MEETNKTFNHPQITSLYKLYLLETQPFRKVHRMIDLFETIIKMHTVVILAEYFKYNKLSDSAKGLLSQGLRTPSLGTWQLFSRVLFTELQNETYSWTIEEIEADFIISDNELNSGLLKKGTIIFPTYDKEKLSNLKALRKLRKSNFDDVIALRNSYAHGATPTDESCLMDIKIYEPFVVQLVQLNWIKNSSLELENNQVILNYHSKKLSLHPLLLYRKEANEASFAFFNDIKKDDKIGLLNYPLGKHYREKEFYQEFQNYLPLNEWKKSGSNDFQQRVEELTETFKGRIVEREKLLNFVSNHNKGYLSIQGNPGIGKSALIAQFFKDLKGNDSFKNIFVVEYFIRRGTQQAQIEYLLEYLNKKTDELFPKAKEIKAEGKMVFDLQNQLFSKWRLWAEHNNGNTLLFLIDGLDEGVENNLVNYLPRENFQNILFIYGSRPGGHKSIDELWGSLPIENHIKLELGGLGKEDIRAMIYEVANKYELERESVWIDAVQVRSQGNPLYLKLLCDAIANNSIGINDIHALPKEIDDYYKAILQRYAQDTVDGDDLLMALYTFAAAKDYLTMAHIGLINQLSEAKLQRIGSTLKEVLYENPLTENVLDYQLFHESFREYLCREKVFKISESKEQIINFCATWKELAGTWEQCYTLEHYASHLSESNKANNHETLLKLIYNNEYTNTQNKVLRHFNASNRLMRLALLKSGELENHETMLEAALCLVDLKYEEANDAPRIVEMVANNEMDLALLRIESFGGNDKEGLQQKFILYMLCLMELTLLESKNKPFRKEAIERLLKHFDENLPVDHSVLNWNDFFSSYLVFLISVEIKKLDLDYYELYKRTNNCDYEWIVEKGPYSKLQFGILHQAFQFNHSSYALEDISSCLAIQGSIEQAIQLAKRATYPFQAFEKIVVRLAKQGYVEEAIQIYKELNDPNIEALSTIATSLAKQGNIKQAAITINDAIKIANKIANEDRKIDIFLAISTSLYEQGNIEQATITIQEALHLAKENESDFFRNIYLNKISKYLANQGNIEEAILVAKFINDENDKSSAFKNISFSIASEGNIEAAMQIIQFIEVEHDKDKAYERIAVGLVKQDNLEHSLQIADKISSEYIKYLTFIEISMILIEQGDIKQATQILKDSIKIQDETHPQLRIKIAVCLAKALNIEQAFQIIRGMDEWESLEALKEIFEMIGETENIEQLAKIMLLSISTQRSIPNSTKKSILLEIELSLIKQGNKESSNDLIKQEIEDDINKKSEAPELDEAFLLNDIQSAKNISDAAKRSNCYLEISNILFNQGMKELTFEVIQLAIQSANEIVNQNDKEHALVDLALRLTEYGSFEQALKIVIDRSHPGMNEVLFKIAVGIAEHGDIDYALQIANDNCETTEKIDIYLEISNNLFKKGIKDQAFELIQLAIQTVKELLDWQIWIKDRVYKDISFNLIKQENYTLAIKIAQKIISSDNRFELWNKFGQEDYQKNGLKFCMSQLQILTNDEAQLFYKKGIVESISIAESSEILIISVLEIIKADVKSIEMLMQKYALYLTFFVKTKKEKLQLLNKTLNLQWAIDIAAKFEKEFERASNNVQEWINEIEDKNDREDVLGWAEKVEQGKMTEEKFLDKINKL